MPARCRARLLQIARIKIPEINVSFFGLNSAGFSDLTAFYGKPIDQIGRVESGELDWGKAEGSEVW